MKTSIKKISTISFCILNIRDEEKVLKFDERVDRKARKILWWIVEYESFLAWSKSVVRNLCAAAHWCVAKKI